MAYREIGMYSPHPKAKLYKRYSDNKDILADMQNITVELNNYVNYKSFKWVFDTEIATSQQEQKGLVENDSYCTIKTNTLTDINAGDIVYIKCGVYPQGKYFTVTGQVKQDYIYTPKMRLTYKHLELKSLL